MSTINKGDSAAQVTVGLIDGIGREARRCDEIAVLRPVKGDHERLRCGMADFVVWDEALD